MRHMGVWKLRVTGPEALLAVHSGEVEVTGLGGDEWETANLQYKAYDEVARSMGYKFYDDLPEQYTPITFGEPVLSANEYVTPDGTQQWFVGVYSVNRDYGGPEEGGWWFDTGELVQSTAVNSLAEAEALREKLREEFPDTGKSSSVLGGDDYGIRIGIVPHAKYFPEERPRYE